jgi:hypothetical protein
MPRTLLFLVSRRELSSIAAFCWWASLYVVGDVSLISSSTGIESSFSGLQPFSLGGRFVPDGAVGDGSNMAGRAEKRKHEAATRKREAEGNELRARERLWAAEPPNVTF